MSKEIDQKSRNEDKKWNEIHVPVQFNQSSPRSNKSPDIFQNQVENRKPTDNSKNTEKMAQDSKLKNSNKRDIVESARSSVISQVSSENSTHYVWNDNELALRGMDLEKDIVADQLPLTIFHLYKARCGIFPRSRENLPNEEVVKRIRKFYNSSNQRKIKNKHLYNWNNFNDQTDYTSPVEQSDSDLLGRFISHYIFYKENEQKQNRILDRYRENRQQLGENFMLSQRKQKSPVVGVVPERSNAKKAKTQITDQTNGDQVQIEVSFNSEERSALNDSQSLQINSSNNNIINNLASLNSSTLSNQKINQLNQGDNSIIEESVSTNYNSSQNIQFLVPSTQLPGTFVKTNSGKHLLLPSLDLSHNSSRTPSPSQSEILDSSDNQKLIQSKGREDQFTEKLKSPNRLLEEREHKKHLLKIPQVQTDKNTLQKQRSLNEEETMKQNGVKKVPSYNQDQLITPDFGGVFDLSKNIRQSHQLQVEEENQLRESQAKIKEAVSKNQNSFMRQNSNEIPFNLSDLKNKSKQNQKPIDENQQLSTSILNKSSFYLNSMSPKDISPQSSNNNPNQSHQSLAALKSTKNNYFKVQQDNNTNSSNTIKKSFFSNINNNNSNNINQLNNTSNINTQHPNTSSVQKIPVNIMQNDRPTSRGRGDMANTQARNNNFVLVPNRSPQDGNIRNHQKGEDAQKIKFIKVTYEQQIPLEETGNIHTPTQHQNIKELLAVAQQRAAKSPSPQFKQIFKEN